MIYLPKIQPHSSASELADADLVESMVSVRDLLAELGEVQNPRALSIAASAWTGYEYTLGVYGMAMCHEWRIERLNSKGSLHAEIHDLMDGWPHDFNRPPWIGDLDIHRSHRSILCDLNPGAYEERFPNTPELMPILWPQLTPNDLRGYRLRLSDGDARLLKRDFWLPVHLYYDSNKREVLKK